MRHLGLAVLAIALLTTSLSPAQDKMSAIDIDIDTSKLGNYIDGNLSFTNSDGKLVELGKIIDKPTIIALVYYECPSICTPLLNDLKQNLDMIIGQQDPDYEMGKDYQVLTISFDHEEGVDLAKDKKESYYEIMNMPIPEDGWRFMVGKKDQIDLLCRQIGFNFALGDDEEYQHPAVLTIVDKDRQIVRYLRGSKFNPFDIRMGLNEAKKGVVGGVRIPKNNSGFRGAVRNFCFTTNPESGKKVMNITRIAGGGTIVFLLGYFLFFTFAVKVKT